MKLEEMKTKKERKNQKFKYELLFLKSVAVLAVIHRHTLLSR